MGTKIRKSLLLYSQAHEGGYTFAAALKTAKGVPPFCWIFQQKDLRTSANYYGERPIFFQYSISERDRQESLNMRLTGI